MMANPYLTTVRHPLTCRPNTLRGLPFQGLMAVPNKGALTLNTPKVSDSKGNPDGPALRLSADRWVLTVHPLKLQTIPSYSSALFMFFTPFTLSLNSFMCEGYEAKWISRLSAKKNRQQLQKQYYKIINTGATLHVNICILN